MNIRPATLYDAEAIRDIYAPIVSETTISFELDPPTVAEMRSRVENTLKLLPWLVSLDELGNVSGYVYASRHRERAAYRWAVDVSAYVRADCRGRGIGRSLYATLFDELVSLGYYQAFAGIALPNEASVALHESVGFSRLGVYRKVGFKHGAWRDVGWWQRQLQEPFEPNEPKAYSSDER
jgi:phosphinothricin acetyltransferase